MSVIFLLDSNQINISSNNEQRIAENMFTLLTRTNSENIKSMLVHTHLAPPYLFYLTCCFMISRCSWAALCVIEVVVVLLLLPQPLHFSQNDTVANLSSATHWASRISRCWWQVLHAFYLSGFAGCSAFNFYFLGSFTSYIHAPLTALGCARLTFAAHHCGDVVEDGVWTNRDGGWDVRQSVAVGGIVVFP